MLLVIFGAGASYDSAPSYPLHLYPSLGERPPLANQLFDRSLFAEALKGFHECQPLVTRLRAPRQGQTIEELLLEFQEQASVDPRRHTQLAAIRYYLHYVLQKIDTDWETKHKGVTNYKTLLDDIEHWRLKSNQKVCIVTFMRCLRWASI